VCVCLCVCACVRVCVCELVCVCVLLIFRHICFVEAVFATRILIQVHIQKKENRQYTQISVYFIFGGICVMLRLDYVCCICMCHLYTYSLRVTNMTMCAAFACVTDTYKCSIQDCVCCICMCHLYTYSLRVTNMTMCAAFVCVTDTYKCSIQDYVCCICMCQLHVHMY
jgi:hypothetical protein